MFNENEIKPLVSTDIILDNIDDEEIFKHYINHDFQIGDTFSSPLRDKDDFPSFGIFRSFKYNGLLLFKDLATGEMGDATVFVKKLFDYGTIYEACSRIAIDFGIDKEYCISDNISSNTLDGVLQEPKKRIVRKESLQIQVKIRDWIKEDKLYWSQYGITKSTLQYYNVRPITHYFINKTPVKCELLSYAYTEEKDGEVTYKIYQPNISDRKLKWKSNVNNSIWQGWMQIPEKGDMIILTKSYKDIMSIKDTSGYNSVALQSESCIPKESVVEEIKSRFTTVYVLFDNDYNNPDNPGRKFAIGFAKQFNVIHIEIPSEYKSKDYSDLVKNHGAEKAKEILKKLIKNDKN